MIKVIVVTTPYIPRYKIVRVLGVVHGLTIRTRGLGGQLTAAIQSLFGGRIDAYVSELEKAREEALNRLIEKARIMGANAVVGVDFETSDILGTAIVISVYGTAVVAEPEGKYGNSEAENKHSDRRKVVIYGYK